MYRGKLLATLSHDAVSKSGTPSRNDIPITSSTPDKSGALLATFSQNLVSSMRCNVNICIQF